MLPFNYTTHDDKLIAFAGYRVIDSAADFDAWYNETQQRPNYLFRGIREAAFKNYTSAQRELFKHHFRNSTTRPYITAQIKALREVNDHLIERYAEAMGIPRNFDLFVLSFAQHYGGISPLLDFTTCLETALYFMCEEGEPLKENTELKDYASLYIADKQHLEPIDKIVEIVGIVHEPSAKAGHQVLQDSITDSGVRLLSYRAMANALPPVPWLIENKKYNTEVGKNRFDFPLTVSNLNIVAQDGCFIYYDPQNPISFERPLMCVDIRKELIPYIRERYLQHKTKETLFPLETKITEESKLVALANLSLD